MDMRFQSGVSKISPKAASGKESIFEQAAKTMGKEKVLIVCDRDALDSKAYMCSAEFDKVLQDLSKDEIEAA